MLDVHATFEPPAARVPAALLSPELRLVFRSADPDASGPELVGLVAAVSDWERVFFLADREVAGASMWRALRSAGAELPPAVADALRKRAMISDLAMQHLARRAQETVRLFVERSIPVLLLKGAAVGALADPTFRARPMTDLDLLVHGDDVPRARATVIEAGWPETTDPVLLELLKDAHHLPHFVDPQIPGMRLELHVKLMPHDHPFALSAADLWRDARPAPAPFAGASVPSPEHLLLHGCVHFAWQHTMHFGAWRGFRSIATVVATPAFDWDRFVGEARAAKASTSCYWTLRLASRLGGLRIPSATLDALSPPTAAWLRDALERHFIAGLDPTERAPSPSVKMTRLLWRAALRPHWSGHRDPGRLDPEHRWERARGTRSTETTSARLLRHLRSYHDWWRFVTGTLLP